MKKIFTILAIAAVSTSAFAQTHDLRVELDTYTNNLVVSGSVGTDGFATAPLSTAFTITNDGSAIAAGDTIVYGLILNGQGGALGQNGFVPGGFYVIPDSVLATGDFLSRDLGGLLLGFGTETAVGTQRTLCLYAALVGESVWASATSFDATYNGDATEVNNSACVIYELNGTVIDLNVGIGEGLETIANKTFILNNQLVIENNSVDFNSPAIINVISITGQVVASENMVIERGRNTVDLNNISAGIYVVSIQVEDQLSTTKVMVR